MRGDRIKRGLKNGSFIQRVVRTWNKLPEEVVEVGTITTFEIYLDKYIDRTG